MAYHSTAGTAQDSRDFMAAHQQFLVETVGWTLQDSGEGTTPFFVLASSGESGREDIYLQTLDQTSSANRVNVRAYHYWNPTSHQGIMPAYNNSYNYIRTSDSSPFLYWIFADLDHWFVVTKLGSTYYGQYAGAFNRFWSADVAVVQADVNAGTAVPVTVDNAAILQAGRAYMIRDDLNIERVTVTEVNTTTNTVTLANLSNAFNAGAKIGEDPTPVLVGDSDSPGRFYATNRFDGYDGASGQHGECKVADGDSAYASNQDKRYGLTVMYPWLVFHTNQSYNELRGQLIEVYAVGSNDLDSEDVIQQDNRNYRVFSLSGAGTCAVRE